MIQGIENFIEYFKDYEKDYIVIGGLATAMNMHELGFVFRATKDIDLVVVAKENESFLKKLLAYIEEAGYQTKQRTDNANRRNLFRFFDSEDKSYPEQIELFVAHDTDSVLLKDQHIVPIHTPEDYAYLSAILLDSDYFNLLLQHSTIIDGLHVATPEVLIPLKAHAYLNLTEAGSSDAKKHLNDVVKLSTLLDGETQISLTGLPREDMDNFFAILSDLDEDRVVQLLKSIGVGGLLKGDILSVMKSVYGTNVSMKN